jgi:hypothetical protein
MFMRPRFVYFMTSMQLPDTDCQTLTRSNPTSSSSRFPHMVSHKFSSNNAPHSILAFELCSRLSRPSLRDRLVFQHPIYSTGELSRAYSKSLRFNWPFQDADILSYNPASQTWVLSELFERYSSDLSNWTMADDFFNGFVELRLDIPSNGETSGVMRYS